MAYALCHITIFEPDGTEFACYQLSLIPSEMIPNVLGVALEAYLPN